MPAYKAFTIEELKEKLIEFHDNHSELGNNTEIYGETANLYTICSLEFLYWLETGKYWIPELEKNVFLNKLKSSDY